MNRKYISHFIWCCLSVFWLTSCSESITSSPSEQAALSLAWKTPEKNDASSRVLLNAPVAQIQSPQSSATINVGDSLYFSAVSSGAQVPLIYQWDFGGSTVNSTRQTPGDVMFLKAGVFTVSLDTINSEGTKSTSPALMSLIVRASTVNQAPTAYIVSPAADQIISVGDSVSFVGSVLDPENNAPFLYDWQFNGGAVNSRQLNPGFNVFNTVGVFKVSLMATDSLGQIDTNPPSRYITVNDIVVNNADFPDGVISSPAADVTINIGDSVDFSGVGDSVAGNTPLSFLWNFDGSGEPDLTVDIPGLVLFDMAGVFVVSFTVTDSLMQEDPTPAEVIVTVIDPNVAPPVDAPPADTPMGEITSPDSDVTILAGEAVDFMGMGGSPIGNDPVTYLWDFDGGAADFTDQNPGLVVFDTEGVYEVVLTVTDSAGIDDPMPPSIMVTVDPAVGTPAPNPAPVDPTVPADAPMAEITLPDMDVIIVAGDSVEFTAMAGSPVGNDPLTFLWDFGGGAPESVEQNPGLVQFNVEGIFEVVLEVTDSVGNVNPTPPTIIVTVDPSGTQPPDAQPIQPTPQPSPQPGDEPTGEIVLPDADIIISVGDVVIFEGDGDSPVNSGLSFLWDFDGAASDSMEMIPGEIMFNQEGVFTVTLTVTDEAGLSDLAPPTVEVTVEP